ncbi:Hypothetical_protein [Hexamita inflata]|uniref:Hypothetical_protein n=1 Tax=Hexamita inflata TaxID=28002 RepID=A0AA86QP09_9EUKA|nr:Hypothetical protein HINF_LOCUS45233 [Hexamita inflata]
MVQVQRNVIYAQFSLYFVPFVKNYVKTYFQLRLLFLQYLQQIGALLQKQLNAGFQNIRTISYFIRHRAEDCIAGILALFSVIDDGFIRLRFSFLVASHFLRCGSAKSVVEGKIPRFKVMSIIKDRYGQGYAINEPSGLESGNRSIASLETTTQVDSRIDKLARSSRVTPLDVPESCTCLIEQRFMQSSGL